MDLMAGQAALRLAYSSIFSTSAFASSHVSLFFLAHSIWLFA